MKKKKLLFYSKGKFDEFAKQFKGEGEDIYPISYLTDKNIALKYTGINGTEHFVIDITVMVLSAQVRNDLRIIYESWINALNEVNESNVEYCVEQTYLKEACEIFSFYFQKYEEADIVGDESASNEVIEEYPLFSIMNCGQEDRINIYNKLDEQLYGHNKFKENFRKQLEAFIILYKMQRKKIFSVLICGKSGIGKTEVGRILQKTMYPNESAIKINFGNYSGKGSLWSLIGSPKGYLGSEQGGELTNKILNSKSKIIVIDELDKADEAIFTFFYEMLEDGQYTDLDGKVIDLNGYIVIFTANLNKQNFKEMIPEPLFSRFDMTYEFEKLSISDKEKFISEFTDQLIEDYTRNIGDLDATNIREQVIEKSQYRQLDNLRMIKRNVMNAFVELVGGL